MRPHISIHVSDVPKSVAFYKKVFGLDPQKQTSTYAKFDLREPALNFSMSSGEAPVSRVSHLGIEVDSAAEVTRWEKHLVAQGIMELKEDDSECCFARQDKVWFRDPDGTPWEVFYVHEQLPVTESAESKQGACCPETGCC